MITRNNQIIIIIMIIKVNVTIFYFL